MSGHDRLRKAGGWAAALTVLALAAILALGVGCSEKRRSGRRGAGSSAPADAPAAPAPTSRPAPEWVRDAENDVLPGPLRYPQGDPDRP